MQKCQVNVENDERRCTDPWMLLHGGENITPRSWRREDLSRGAASPCHYFHEGSQTYILVHGDDFFLVGRREGRKHTLSLLQGACELSKVVTLGPEFVTVSDSQFPWEEH